MIKNTIRTWTILVMVVLPEVLDQLVTRTDYPFIISINRRSGSYLSFITHFIIIISATTTSDSSRAFSILYIIHRIIMILFIIAALAIVLRGGAPPP